MPTEEQIRQWAREEWNKKEAEKQAACTHMVSGTLRADGKVYCESCGLPLEWRDRIEGDPVNKPGSVPPVGRKIDELEQSGIDFARGQR